VRRVGPDQRVKFIAFFELDDTALYISSEHPTKNQ